jgi:hypothetical protein
MGRIFFLINANKEDLSKKTFLRTGSTTILGCQHLYRQPTALLGHGNNIVLYSGINIRGNDGGIDVSTEGRTLA